MQNSEFLNFLDDLIKYSIKMGATSADAVAVDDISIGVEMRGEVMESIERSQNKAYSIRTFVDNKFASVSSSEFSLSNAKLLIDRAISMAQNSPADPDAGIANSEQISKIYKELELFDNTELSSKELIDMAIRAEKSMKSVQGIVNSEGTSASTNKSYCAMAASNGFARSMESSAFIISSSAVAGGSDGMQTDYDYHNVRFLEDLDSPEDIGMKAAKRAVSKLNPKKISTQEISVIYSPRVARGLLGAFATAINGASVARGGSFLGKMLGKQVFNSAINIIDDPHIIRGLGSRDCDAEGLITDKIDFVDNGTLNQWILDLKSARKLKMKPNARASRGLGTAPYPSSSNLFIAPGKNSVNDLIKNCSKAILITELFGMGENQLTGDYSQGASGMWIENGEICYPVSEFTVGSTMQEMFLSMIPADDLEMRYQFNSPSLFIPKVTVSGR